MSKALNNHAAAVRRSSGHKRSELLLSLWERTKGLIYLKARRFWNAHMQSCAARGVDLHDVESIAWDVFMDAVNSWTPESEYNFTSFLDYPFKNRCAELLNIRTERGRREPLNNCSSLDCPLEDDDGDGSSLHELVRDPDADFIDDLIDGLNAEQEAAAVHEAVEGLPDRMQFIINHYYFDGMTLTEIAALLGVSLNRVSQLHRDALRLLRGNRRLQLVCADRTANKDAQNLVRLGVKGSSDPFSIYERAWERASILSRAHENEMLEARETDPEESDHFIDQLAGILAKHITTQQT